MNEQLHLRLPATTSFSTDHIADVVNRFISQRQALTSRPETNEQRSHAGGARIPTSGTSLPVAIRYVRAAASRTRMAPRYKSADTQRSRTDSAYFTSNPSRRRRF
jgi:hypothetical protein